MQRAARDEIAPERDEVGALYFRQALQRAVGRRAIGMAGEGARAPGAPRQGARIIGLVAQSRAELLAHPRNGRFIEARLVDGKAQQFARALDVANERAHAPAHIIAIAIEGDFDRLLIQRLLESLRIERPRALVQQRRQHRRRARLAGRILRRAALEREFERQQRDGVILDEPGLDAARRLDLLHVHRARGGRLGDGSIHGRFHRRICAAFCWSNRAGARRVIRRQPAPRGAADDR